MAGWGWRAQDASERCQEATRSLMHAVDCQCALENEKLRLEEENCSLTADIETLCAGGQQRPVRPHRQPHFAAKLRQMTVDELYDMISGLERRLVQRVTEL